MDKALGNKMSLKEISIKEEELIPFIYDTFQEDALLEISYNRVFIPGKILFIEKEDNIITLQLKGELLNQTVDIELEDILHEIVELRYTYEDEELIIEVIN